MYMLEQAMGDDQWSITSDAEKHWSMAQYS